MHFFRSRLIDSPLTFSIISDIRIGVEIAMISFKESVKATQLTKMALKIKTKITFFLLNSSYVGYVLLKLLGCQV